MLTVFRANDKTLLGVMLKIGRVSIVASLLLGFVSVNERKLYFGRALRVVRRLGAAARGLFPKAYFVSFWCCDTRRVYATSYVLTFNALHAKRVMGDLLHASEDTRFSTVTLTTYVKEKMLKTRFFVKV
jgi:hypothetical protein